MLKDKRKAKERFPRKPEIIPARLGDGAGNVHHPTLTNYCYAQIGGQIEVVYNDQTPMTDGLQVECGRDTLGSSETPGIFRVLRMRTTSPGGLGATVGALSLEAIAAALQYKRVPGGTNPLWVEGMQFLPLRVGQASGLTVQVQPGIVTVGGGAEKRVPYQIVDLTAHLPSTAGEAAMILIAVSDAGAVTSTKGAEFTLASAAADYYLTERPAAPAGTAKELALVRMYAGQTLISEGVGPSNTDFVDLRFSGKDSYGPASVLTTRGDLLYRNATVPARLAIGGVSGSVLTRDANDPAWSAFALGGGNAAAVYSFPAAASGTIPLLNLAQTFTAQQTIQNSNRNLERIDQLVIDTTAASGGQSVINFKNQGTAKGYIRVDSLGAMAIEGLGSIDFNYNTGPSDVNFWGGDTTIDVVFKKTSGNVGIGEILPGARLQVQGATSGITAIFRAGTTPGNVLQIQDNLTAIHSYLTATGGMVGNEQGTATGDLRWEGDTVTDVLHVIASADAARFGGGQRYVPAIKSANYTLTTKDSRVVFTATATATLPSATGTGQEYRLICRAGTLTIDGNGTDTIKGSLTQYLIPGEDLIITDTAAGVWE